MNAGELHNVLADAGLPLLLDVLENPDGALANARPQDDALATYAPKIEKAEARLDWQRSAAELDRQIRAFNPFPVCWTELDDCRIKIWEAEPAAGSGAPGALLSAEDTGLRVACGDGVLRLTRLQLAGGKPLPVAELLRSRRQLFAEGVGFR
jgi:methionyl-tRNA formyltransferase